MKSVSDPVSDVLHYSAATGQNNSTAVNFEIKPYNIDASGHVNNAVYINWLEDLRIKLFWKLIQLPKLAYKNIYLVVSSTNIKYKTPLFLYDKPTGTMKIDKYCRGIWYLSAEFEVEDRITTVASQKCVLLDGRANRMIKEITFNDEKKIYEINKH